MILAVLDTNALAAGFRKVDDPSSTAGRILDHWIDGDFELACSGWILEELSRTLNNRYFRRHLSDAQIERAIQLIRDE